MPNQLMEMLTGEDPAADVVNPVIRAIKGYAGQGQQFNLSEWTSDDDFAVRVRNRGEGGHFQVRHSTSGDPMFEVTDGGVTSVDTFSAVNDLSVGTDLTVVNDSFLGHNLEVGNDLFVLDDLIVTGETTTGVLHVTGDATIDDDLTVTGDTILTLLNVTGDATVGNILNVSLDLFVDQNATIANDLIVGDDLDVESDVTIGGNLGHGSSGRIGFFGHAVATQQSVAGSSSDLASVISLANSLRNLVRAYGLAP